MEMSQITPGCYYHTASEWAHDVVSTHDFFLRCLSHLGPTESRVQHPEDVDRADQQLYRLFWKDTFGPVAAAIQLCESDSLAGSVDVEGLVPLFVACTDASQTIESIQTSDSQNVLASPLFRQALIVAALGSGNQSLARDLINHAPTTPPPPEMCVFTMQPSSLRNEQRISAGVWAALVVTGWAPTSRNLVLWAASSNNGPEGVALLNAIIAAGYDMHANPMFPKSLPAFALTTGEPEVVEYLYDLYSVTTTNDMLIQAVEVRNKGGVGNLRWLLDTHHLDVNYVRQGSGPFDKPPTFGDPRDRAEREHAAQLAGESIEEFTREWERQQALLVPVQGPRTAFQAAARWENTEACEFLLGRGASENAGGEQ
ncbi:hypothetical protein F4781DRAFT_416266 [Annulohypoxylon bovei var. microspora]|nr:hypothetical protein F4781DRAFT_416266 [Annulohypoxylon bovei var. microspora]